ncbi:hypothetical protein LIER_25218 [Lithospermum erythrorhizon]|uniref:Uncharacterized protein n=1 Tax=Lithospermum erythrorhizon TaxID=34254 RepID=A0AAV3R749_LITER
MASANNYVNLLVSSGCFWRHKLEDSDKKINIRAYFPFVPSYWPNLYAMGCFLLLFVAYYDDTISISTNPSASPMKCVILLGVHNVGVASTNTIPITDTESILAPVPPVQIPAVNLEVSPIKHQLDSITITTGTLARAYPYI